MLRFPVELALERIEIDQPSEHAIMHLAAARIVQLAAP